MNTSLNITKMGVKSDTICFPGVSLLRVPEYFKQTPYETTTNKLFKLHNVLLWKNNSISLGLSLSLKSQETA